MIEFKKAQIRDTAVVYGSSLQQVKEMYAIDPNMAGELAISILEVALTGTMSTNNPLIKVALANFKDVAGKNQVKYDKKLEAKREIRAKKLQLEEIAAMLKGGMSQKDIALKLGKAASTINSAVRVLKTEYPELMGGDSENSGGIFEFSSNFSGDSTNSDEFDEDTMDSTDSIEFDEFVEFDEICSDSMDSTNSMYDNVNVNVNDNVNVELSSREESFRSIKLSELNRMGVSFEWLDGGTIRVRDTGKVFRVIM